VCLCVFVCVNTHTTHNTRDTDTLSLTEREREREEREIIRNDKILHNGDMRCLCRSFLFLPCCCIYHLLSRTILHKGDMRVRVCVCVCVCVCVRERERERERERGREDCIKSLRIFYLRCNHLINFNILFFYLARGLRLYTQVVNTLDFFVKKSGETSQNLQKNYIFFLHIYIYIHAFFLKTCFFKKVIK
jgi:hypothetical protein